MTACIKINNPLNPKNGKRHYSKVSKVDVLGKPYYHIQGTGCILPESSIKLIKKR